MEIETKHTAGEWQVLWGNYTHFATINSSIEKRICALEVSNSILIPEQTANAKLIAASPDLLDALIEIREWYESVGEKHFGDYTPVCFSKGLSAILKATK